ncbi:acyl carrier protein [Rhodococcus coprophilus]|uniref:Acyl carrier protein n=1 Tax=Rhodococcus coprophilus TaxID=38310 RepID=A0A2X4U7A0_9NOCA|nr:acyl carrier protein [Rhodococcus coprophilus]MBM7460773.1 acyl carrier protein [Rhodococcus coprophilus]SQI28580.1 acyl carrier protein [Rhodococcus coprophilus]
MSATEIIKEILTQKFEVDSSDITDEATFETMDLDSLSQVEFGTALRKRLGIDLPDAELQEVETLSDVYALVEKKLPVR